MDFSLVLDYLKVHLTKNRYEHSLGVKEAAVALAKVYGISEERCSIAALLHDCAKWMSEEELIALAKEHGYSIDLVMYNNAQLLHGICGSIVSKETFKIEDREILSSIEFHTTGKAEMSLLEKIIYLADYIEPGRSFPGVEQIREAAFRDLDEALLLCFDSTISFVLQRGQLLHKDTVEGRNYLLMNRRV